MLKESSRAINKDLTYLCEATELPGRAFTNVDLRYYGPQFKIPYLSVYEDLNMTFLCRTESFEREFFDNWMESINPTTSFDFAYRDDYSTTIELFQYSEQSKAVYQWALFDAFPIFINPQPVTFADDNIQKLTVTFTYTKYRRNNKDITRPLHRYAATPDGGEFTKQPQSIVI